MKAIVTIVLCCILFCSCSSNKLVGEWSRESTDLSGKQGAILLIFEKSGEWKQVASGNTSYGNYETKEDSLHLTLQKVGETEVKETKLNYKYSCTDKTLTLVGVVGNVEIFNKLK